MVNHALHDLAPRSFVYWLKWVQRLINLTTGVKCVGIELWRATALGFGGLSDGFPLGLSPTPLTHVSIGPPTIPDGRISRVRF